jgi:hypothetical protein
LANRLCNTIVYHLLRCHLGKFHIFLVLLIIAKKICLSVANLTLNLLRSTWSSFSFPFWSYSRQTSLLAASIDLSVSQSARVDKSLKFSGLSLSTLKTVMVSYGFYHKHQGWAFSFLHIRSVASSILFYVTSMLVCWQRLQETFSNQESVGLLWNWAIAGLITYPAGLVRVLETHELKKISLILKKTLMKCTCVPKIII